MKKTRTVEQILGGGFSDGQKARIRKLRKAGKSIKAIAKELHVSDRRVSDFVRSGFYNKEGKLIEEGVPAKAKKPLPRGARKPALVVVGSPKAGIPKEVKAVIRQHMLFMSELLKSIGSCMA